MVSTQEVTEYLTEIDFPAHRDDIVRSAEQLDAPDGVVKALRAMPPVVYENKDEVRRSAHTETEPGQDPGHRAAQARDSQHEQIAQHLREV